MKIIVTRPNTSEEYSFKAEMEDRPEKVGWGRTPAEAVGELISANFEMQVWLGLEIMSKAPAEKPPVEIIEEEYLGPVGTS